MSSRNYPMIPPHHQPIENTTVCGDWDRSRQIKAHRKALKRIKPSIDNKPPPTFSHLSNRLKRAQMEDERCAQIERDNKTLVHRMVDVMKRPPGFDNARPNAAPTSLNHSRRRHELERITKENHALLKRLQEQPPTYNHLVMEQERGENEDLQRRIRMRKFRDGGHAVGSAYTAGDETPSPSRSPGRSSTRTTRRGNSNTSATARRSPSTPNHDNNSDNNNNRGGGFNNNGDRLPPLV